MRRFVPSLHTGVVIAAALFAVFAAIAIGFAAPPFNSADEAAHFDYAVTIWHGHLPVFQDGLTISSPFGTLPPVQWVSQHPPLFYAILAPVVGPLWDSGQLYTAVLAGRGINAVLAGLTVLAVGWATGRVLPGRPAVSSVAAVVVSLTSMFLLVGGAVYNDLPNVGFGALAIGVGATAIRRGLSWRLVTLGAVVTAGGMLSRLSFAVFVVAVVVAFVVARRTGWWGTVLGKAIAVVVVGVAPVLSAGWFFLRNRELTGNIAGSQPAWAAENLHRVHTGFVETVTARSFWTGVFSVFRGHFKVDGEWTWLMLLVPLLLALVVVLVPALRRGRLRTRRTPLADALVAAMLVGVFVLVVFLQVRFTMQGGAAQARYGLPLMPVLAVAMAVGLTGFGRFVTPVLVTGWVATATYGWFTILDLSRPAFTAPDTLTIARVAVVLAFVALAAVLVGVWVGALRPAPRGDEPDGPDGPDEAAERGEPAGPAEPAVAPSLPTDAPHTA